MVERSMATGGAREKGGGEGEKGTDDGDNNCVGKNEGRGTVPK